MGNPGLNEMDQANGYELSCIVNYRPGIVSPKRAKYAFVTVPAVTSVNNDNSGCPSRKFVLLEI